MPEYFGTILGIRLVSYNQEIVKSLMAQMDKTRIMLPPFTSAFTINAQDSRVIDHQKLTYLHPLGGLEIAHQLGRRLRTISFDFELYTNEAVEMALSGALFRYLGLCKSLAVPILYFSLEYSGFCYISQIEVIRMAGRPYVYNISLELKEIPLLSNLDTFKSGIALGSVVLTLNTIGV